MKGLTQAKRDQARKRAERSIRLRLGEKPNRAQYNNHVASQFPRWFTVGIGIMLAVVALAAGFISGVRLYSAGQSYADKTIGFLLVTVIIGGCTVLAAEVLVILATVAGQIYMRGWNRLISIIPVALGMIVAFVGNWTVTDPSTMWGWVETGFPPIAVLSVAFFFEITLVPELERRQADDNAFELARAEWQQMADNIADHPDWSAVWANALRDALLRYNSLTVDALTPDEWRAVVGAEMNAEQWWNIDGIPSEQKKRSKAKRKSSGGLVHSVRGDYSQVEKVVMLFQANPDLADKGITPVNEAIAEIGCGNSTYYAAAEIHARNGSDSDGSEGVHDE